MKIKNSINIIILLFFITLTTNAYSADFRNTSWGMTKSQVKSAEKSTFVDEISNVLLYRDRLVGIDVNVGYIFIDNKLVRAAYSFQEKYTNKNDHIRDYNSITEILKKKYGKPKLDEQDWSNSLYTEDVEDYGLAISIGHLAYTSEWDTPKTDITHSLFGNNYEITHVVIYTSKENSELIKEKEEKENQKDF